MFLRALSAAALLLFPHLSHAEESRDLPAEIKALATACSSVGAVEYKGQIEAGINKFLGKMIQAEGAGEFKKEREESDFLKSFEDEKIRLEAKKVYSSCITNAIGIVYNIQNKNKKKPMVSSQELSGIIVDLKQCAIKSNFLYCDFNITATDSDRIFGVDYRTVLYDDLGGERYANHAKMLTNESIIDKYNYFRRKIIDSVKTPLALRFDKPTKGSKMIAKLELRPSAQSAPYIFKNIPIEQ